MTKVRKHARTNKKTGKRTLVKEHQRQQPTPQTPTIQTSSITHHLQEPMMGSQPSWNETQKQQIQKNYEQSLHMCPKREDLNVTIEWEPHEIPEGETQEQKEARENQEIERTYAEFFASERTFVTTTPIQQSPIAAQTQENAENYLRSLPLQTEDGHHEEAVTLDSDGNIIEHRVGVEYSVTFADIENHEGDTEPLDKNKGHFVGTHMLHNHPYQSGLSQEDIMLGMGAGMSQVTAVTNHGSFDVDIRYTGDDHEDKRNAKQIKRMFEVAGRKAQIAMRAHLEASPEQDRPHLLHEARTHQGYLKTKLVEKQMQLLQQKTGQSPSLTFRYRNETGAEHPPGAERWLTAANLK